MAQAVLNNNEKYMYAELSITYFLMKNILSMIRLSRRNLVIISSITAVGPCPFLRTYLNKMIIPTYFTYKIIISKTKLRPPKRIEKNLFTKMLIHVEFILPKEQKFKSAKVKGMSKDPDVKQILTLDQKTLLNSTIYDVDFPNGSIKSYA